MLVEDKINSSFRATVRRQHLERFNPSILDSIVEKRAIFKWLPVTYVTDLEQGAMWWLAASLFSIIIPVFPLVSLYEYWWTNIDLVPRPDHVVAYVLLMWMGIAYSIGSALFHRAVRHPAVPPLFKWKHICTDELHGMWWFFLGTLPSVPVSAIYCFHNGALGQYGLALALSIVASIIMELAVFASYPMEEGQEHREFFAPWVHMIFPADSKIGKYMHNDWLIISWGFLAVALLFDVCLLILMIYWCGRYDVDHSNVGLVGHEIYNFATGLFDTLMFTVGCMYILAGSLGAANHHQHKPAAPGDEENDLEFRDVIHEQYENYVWRDKTVTKPSAEPLSVVLFQGDSFGDGDGEAEEPFDDIPPPEEGPAVVNSSSNRYSLALSRKEFSL